MVNGKDYPVVRTEQGYSVTLDGFDSTGTKKVTADQIILENGRAFDLTSDNEITLQILKEIPQVKDLTAEEDAENGKFRVSFRLTDPDGALSGHKVLIRNQEGRTVGEQGFGESEQPYVFDGELIDRSMTAQALTEQLLTAAQGQRDTNQLVTFYNNVLKNFTGENLTDFLGGLSKSLAGYSDPNEWFADSFGGVLAEEPAYGDTGGKIRYRIWDNLSGLAEGRKSLVLQILTAPQEDMYLISVPSQLLIGRFSRTRVLQIWWTPYLEEMRNIRRGRSLALRRTRRKISIRSGNRI